MARTTISIDGDILKAGFKRTKALKYKSFSAYVEFLVDRDTRERGTHVHVREEPTSKSATLPAKKISYSSGKRSGNDKIDGIPNRGGKK